MLSVTEGIVLVDVVVQVIPGTIEAHLTWVVRASPLNSLVLSLIVLNLEVLVLECSHLGLLKSSIMNLV